MSTTDERIRPEADQGPTATCGLVVLPQHREPGKCIAPVTPLGPDPGLRPWPRPWSAPGQQRGVDRPGVKLPQSGHHHLDISCLGVDPAIQPRCSSGAVSLLSFVTAFIVRRAVVRSRVFGVSCLGRAMVVRVVIRPVRQFLVVPAWRFSGLLRPTDARGRQFC